MLNDMVVAISGGAGKIGSAFTKAVVKNGGKVIIGDISDEKAEKLIDEVGKKNAIYINCDLTKSNQINYFIKQGLKKFDKIDSAVHCSYPRSSQWGTSFEKLNSKKLKEDLFNQLGIAILFSQVFIRYFKKNGYGNLIHLSSIQGISAPKFDHYTGTTMVSPIEYSAIKAGIISITKYLAKYCRGSNIRVNCISPGGIFDDQPDSFVKKYNADCNSKGLLNSEDLNGTLIYLLSEPSRYMNGQNITIDDGWSL